MHLNTQDCSQRDGVPTVPSSPRKYTESYTLSLRAQSTGPTAPLGLFKAHEYYDEPKSPSRFKLGCYKQS